MKYRKANLNYRIPGKNMMKKRTGLKITGLGQMPARHIEGICGTA